MTAIESVLWKNDKKRGSQPSKVSSGESIIEAKLEDEATSVEKISTTLSTAPKDSQEKVSSLFR